MTPDETSKLLAEIWAPLVLEQLKTRVDFTPRPPTRLTKWQHAKHLIRLMQPHVKLWLGPNEPGLYGEDD